MAKHLKAQAFQFFEERKKLKHIEKQEAAKVMFYKMPSRLKISLIHTLVSILIDRLLNSEGNSRTVCMHVFIFFSQCYCLRARV